MEDNVILRDIIENLRIDAPVEQIVPGPYWTAIVSRFCGLSSAMPKASCPVEAGESVATPDGAVEGMSTLALARYCFSGDESVASFGLAAVNSLIEIDEKQCIDGNASDFIIEHGRDKNVSIIGHFPFTEDLKGIAKNVWVIEKRQRPGDYHEDDAQIFLPQSDVIAISSTTLINHTISGIMNLCPPDSIRILLGPSTPMSQVLFDYGIDLLAGTRVTDQEVALQSIKKGANFIQLKSTGSVRLVTMKAKSR